MTAASSSSAPDAAVAPTPARTARRRLGSLWVNGALVAAALVTLFPLVWMVMASLMEPGEASSSPPPFLPAEATLDNYRELFLRSSFGGRLANSLLLAVLATALSLALHVSAGYAFAKLRFRGRDALMKGLVTLMLVPGQVAMIPLFLLLKELGLVNSYAGVLVPAMTGVFGIFLVRQYALSIPDELLEAARLDGASELRIFWSVVLPVLRPILVTLAIFAFLGSWNDFLWPLIVLTDDSRQTLPVALAALSREHAADAELMMAGSVVTIVPVLLVFLALQRYYLRGLMAGSVKA